MIRAAVAAGLVAGLIQGPGAALAQGVPSGQALVLWDVQWEPVEGQGTQAVLRFIAPGIADPAAVDAEAAQADLDWLCQTHAVALADLPYARTDSVVLTLMDRPAPRGEADPDVTRYFGFYDIADGRCEPAEF